MLEKLAQGVAGWGCDVRDVENLVKLGRKMDLDPTLMLNTAEQWLRVRDRHGRLKALTPNQAQRMFEERRGRQNIVLKARQMGMTTWVAGRFFLKTITGRER